MLRISSSSRLPIKKRKPVFRIGIKSVVFYQSHSSSIVVVGLLPISFININTYVKKWSSRVVKVYVRMCG